jgi:hypothetical protein
MLWPVLLGLGCAAWGCAEGTPIRETDLVFLNLTPDSGADASSGALDSGAGGSSSANGAGGSELPPPPPPASGGGTGPAPDAGDSDAGLPADAAADSGT